VPHRLRHLGRSRTQRDRNLAVPARIERSAVTERDDGGENASIFIPHGRGHGADPLRGLTDGTRQTSGPHFDKKPIGLGPRHPIL
jgi:hypothetical protein